MNALLDKPFALPACILPLVALRERITQYLCCTMCVDTCAWQFHISYPYAHKAHNSRASCSIRNIVTQKQGLSSRGLSTHL